MNIKVFEYLVYIGDLTGDLGNIHNLVSFENKRSRIKDKNGNILPDNFIIAEWHFPEPQPTPGQITTIEASVEFATFLTNRNDILQKAEAEDVIDNVDTANKRLFRAIARTMLDITNEERLRHALTPRTQSQMNQAIKDNL